MAGFTLFVLASSLLLFAGGLVGPKMERPITRRMKKGAVRRPNFRADPF